MAAEVAGDLSKAQKRELKWERKQAKVKAAAEAAGQTYVPPSKEDRDKEDAAGKMGKRKKRKLAALQQESGSPAGPTTEAEPASAKPNKKKAVSETAANGESPEGADQSKAEKKAAKKAKKAAAAILESSPGLPSAATNGDADTLKPKKKKKKSSVEVGTAPAQPSASEAAAAEVPKKQSKKQKTGGSDVPQGRITVHQVRPQTLDPRP